MKKVKVQSVIMYLHGQILGPLKVYFSEECYDTVCLHIPSRTDPGSAKGTSL